MIRISYGVFLLKGLGYLGMFWKPKSVQADVFMGVIKISEVLVAHIYGPTDSPVTCFFGPLGATYAH